MYLMYSFITNDNHPCIIIIELLLSVCVYGGGDRREQIRNCSSGVEMVVATPGRLNDLIMNDILKTKSITYLVSFNSLHNINDESIFFPLDLQWQKFTTSNKYT